MHETSAAVAADVRSRYEQRLREELREAESRIRAEYDVRIEGPVSKVVASSGDGRTFIAYSARSRT
jgi:hypothetical protein